MKIKIVVATAVVMLGLARYAAAQSLATPATVPEPATGLLLGIAAGAYGLGRWLNRR